MAITTFLELKAYAEKHFAAEFARPNSANPGWGEPVLALSDGGGFHYCVRVGEISHVDKDDGALKTVSKDVLALLHPHNGNLGFLVVGDMQTSDYYGSVTLYKPFCWVQVPHNHGFSGINQVDALVRYYFLRSGRTAHLNKRDVGWVLECFKQACERIPVGLDAVDEE
jgi:hypothetical protein